MWGVAIVVGGGGVTDIDVVLVVVCDVALIVADLLVDDKCSNVESLKSWLKDNKLFVFHTVIEMEWNIDR